MNVSFEYSQHIGDKKSVPNYTKVPLTSITSHTKKVTELEFLLEVLPKLDEKGPWIADRCLLRTYLELPMSTDIDVFFANIEQKNHYLNELVKSNQFKVISRGEDTKWVQNVIIAYRTRSYTIQLIHGHFFNSPCNLLDDFDMNICQLAYDGKKLYVAEDTIDAIKNRYIAVNHVSNPRNFMTRCMKYARLGFSMDSGQINKFFDTIKANPNSIVKKSTDYEELGK